MRNKVGIVLFLVFISAVDGRAQTGEEPLPEVELDFNERRTNNIENQVVQHSSLVQKEEKLVKIRKTNVKGTYTGNVCAEEVAKKYHFEYVFDHDGGSGLKYLFSNQLKFLMLTFKNGLFWKARYRKEAKDCISRTGDFIG